MIHITKEEYLSAFVDGEAGSFEQHRICDQLRTDGAMREKLSNFALIGESVRNDRQVEAAIAGTSFLSGIQGALADDEPLVIVFDEISLMAKDAIIPKRKRIFPKQALGYAVAASVAAVAAISFQNYIVTSPENGQVQTASVTNSAVQVSTSSIFPSVKYFGVKPTKSNSQDDYFIVTSYKAPDAKTRGLMNKYVAHHLKYASSSNLMPSVRAVSYSTDF